MQKTEIKHWNCFSLISIFFQHGKTVSVFQFRGCADVWNKTAVKQCCRWSAHPWNWNKTKLSTVGWKEATTVGSFVLFQFYFTMCDGLNNTFPEDVYTTTISSCAISVFISFFRSICQSHTNRQLRESFVKLNDKNCQTTLNSMCVNCQFTDCYIAFYWSLLCR